MINQNGLRVALLLSAYLTVSRAAKTIDVLDFSNIGKADVATLSAPKAGVGS